MSANALSRPVLGIAAAIAMLTGCGGRSNSVAPLPVAYEFTLTLVNSVVDGSTPSSVSFDVEEATKSCITFPQPFSDDLLAYGDSVRRTVQLVDCGNLSGWFTVNFHALDLSLADTLVKWTVSGNGVSQIVLKQGGLCITGIKGMRTKGTISAKPPGGCPTK